MSFSNEVKSEISRRKIYSELEALIELSSILKTNASISLRNAFFYINFTTENIEVSKRIYKLIDKIYDYEPSIEFVINDNIQKEGLYTIYIEDEKITQALLASSGIDLYGNYTVEADTLYQRLEGANERKKEAYLRGAFLGAGSIVDPDKGYHLEMIFSKEEDLSFTEKVLKSMQLTPLKSDRKGKFILYFKDSDKISDFLNIIGATNGMLKLENVKAMKDLRNTINRQVNCDTANINKMLKSSSRQVEKILYIKDRYGLKILDRNLQRAAKLRIDHPDLSLRALAEASEDKISKSGLSHRLKKIEEIYDDLVEKETEDNLTNPKNI